MSERWQGLAEVDPDLHALVLRERERQETGLELIASENFVSRAVLEAMGTVLTNKYAEGYPGRRYYGGCEVIDEIERLAVDRAKELFGAEHANVQPHAGAQANLAAFLAVLEPGDAFMGLALPHGGHLTHGSPVNISGQVFRAIPYGVREQTGRIDYDELRTLARAERPKLIVGGGSAYPRAVDFAAMRSIADEVDAVLLVDMAHFAGLVAGGAYPSPVPHAQLITTTTHKTLRGPRGGLILSTEAMGKAVDRRVFPGTQGGPLEHIIAAKAVAFREAATPEFREYASLVVANARALCEAVLTHGWQLVSGGTDSHLLLFDLRDTELTGKEAEQLLDRAGITVNKNMVPGDPRSPFVTSGIRVGVSAVTTRGMGELEMVRIAELMDRVLRARRADVCDTVRGEVRDLAQRFPLYRGMPIPILSSAP
jgi:glycine hydroxymethyltransferase